MTEDLAHRYRELCREDFDAIVTGELVHQAVWLDSSLETAIETYFSVATGTREIFRRLILQREGMSFQSKIDIVRLIVDGGQFDTEYKQQWRQALSKIEEMKAIRNAMAHGKDEGGNGLELTISTVN